MVLNIHDTTPAFKKWQKWMLAGMFTLIYSMFALMAFVLIVYGGQIVVAVFLAVLPILFLLWFLWDHKNLSNSYIEISDNGITVIEYPLGRKAVKHIAYTQIDHARLIRPYSGSLRGPRIRDVGIPYIVFFDCKGNQLFKILAYPESLRFQQSVTQLR